MKAYTPSIPEVQAQTGSNSQPTSTQPLSFTRRPDVGRRGPDPLEYQHRYASLRDYAQLLALRSDLSKTSFLAEKDPRAQFPERSRDWGVAKCRICECPWDL